MLIIHLSLSTYSLQRLSAHLGPLCAAGDAAARHLRVDAENIGLQSNLITALSFVSYSLTFLVGVVLNAVLTLQLVVFEWMLKKLGFTAYIINL
jgi:hypothetical protein